MAEAELNIVLVGRTGNGKSSTGNLILQESFFHAVPHMTTGTIKVDVNSNFHDERLIKVVDTPAELGQIDLSTHVCEEKVTALVHDINDTLSSAAMASTQGRHASLVVLRYGARVTEEDMAILTHLKAMFGENYVKDHAILVMTYGDDFERDEEESGISFTEWTQTEAGYFKEMLDECDGRIVLIDNKTKDETKKKNQISHLLSMVDGLGENLNKRLASEEIPGEECELVGKRTSHLSSYLRKGKGKKTIVCHEWLPVERLTIVFTGISVALVSVTLIITGVKLSDEPVEKEHQNVRDSFFDTGPVCVTCNKLVNYQNGAGEKNPMLDQLTKKIKKNVEMCCAEDWEQLAVLMIMVVQRARKNRAISPSDEKNLLKFSPVTAHKSLIAGDWERGALCSPLPLIMTFITPRMFKLGCVILSLWLSDGCVSGNSDLEHNKENHGLDGGIGWKKHMMSSPWAIDEEGNSSTTTMSTTTINGHPKDVQEIPPESPAKNDSYLEEDVQGEIEKVEVTTLFGDRLKDRDGSERRPILKDTHIVLFKGQRAPDYHLEGKETKHGSNRKPGLHIKDVIGERWSTERSGGNEYRKGQLSTAHIGGDEQLETDKSYPQNSDAFQKLLRDKMTALLENLPRFSLGQLEHNFEKQLEANEKSQRGNTRDDADPRIEKIKTKDENKKAQIGAYKFGLGSLWLNPYNKGRNQGFPPFESQTTAESQHMSKAQEFSDPNTINKMNVLEDQVQTDHLPVASTFSLHKLGNEQPQKSDWLGDTITRSPDGQSDVKHKSILPKLSRQLSHTPQETGKLHQFIYDLLNLQESTSFNEQIVNVFHTSHRQQNQDQPFASVPLQRETKWYEVHQPVTSENSYPFGLNFDTISYVLNAKNPWISFKNQPIAQLSTTYMELQDIFRKWFHHFTDQLSSTRRRSDPDIEMRKEVLTPLLHRILDRLLQLLTSQLNNQNLENFQKKISLTNPDNRFKSNSAFLSDYSLLITYGISRFLNLQNVPSVRPDQSTNHHFLDHFKISSASSPENYFNPEIVRSDADPRTDSWVYGNKPSQISPMVTTKSSTTPANIPDWIDNIWNPHAHYPFGSQQEVPDSLAQQARQVELLPRQSEIIKRNMQTNKKDRNPLEHWAHFIPVFPTESTSQNLVNHNTNSDSQPELRYSDEEEHIYHKQMELLRQLLPLKLVTNSQTKVQKNKPTKTFSGHKYHHLNLLTPSILSQRPIIYTQTTRQGHFKDSLNNKDNTNYHNTESRNQLHGVEPPISTKDKQSTISLHKARDPKTPFTTSSPQIKPTSLPNSYTPSKIPWNLSQKFLQNPSKPTSVKSELPVYDSLLELTANNRKQQETFLGRELSRNEDTKLRDVGDTVGYPSLDGITYQSLTTDGLSSKDKDEEQQSDEILHISSSVNGKEFTKKDRNINLMYDQKTKGDPDTDKSEGQEIKTFSRRRRSIKVVPWRSISKSTVSPRPVVSTSKPWLHPATTSRPRLQFVTTSRPRLQLPTTSRPLLQFATTSRPRLQFATTPKPQTRLAATPTPPGHFGTARQSQRYTNNNSPRTNEGNQASEKPLSQIPIWLQNINRNINVGQETRSINYNQYSVPSPQGQGRSGIKVVEPIQKDFRKVAGDFSTDQRQSDIEIPSQGTTGSDLNSPPYRIKDSNDHIPLSRQPISSQDYTLGQGQGRVNPFGQGYLTSQGYYDPLTKGFFEDEPGTRDVTSSHTFQDSGQSDKTKLSKTNVRWLSDSTDQRSSYSQTVLKTSDNNIRSSNSNTGQRSSVINTIPRSPNSNTVPRSSNSNITPRSSNRNIPPRPSDTNTTPRPSNSNTKPPKQADSYNSYNNPEYSTSRNNFGNSNTNNDDKLINAHDTNGDVELIYQRVNNVESEWMKNKLLNYTSYLPTSSDPSQSLTSAIPTNPRNSNISPPYVTTSQSYLLPYYYYVPYFYPTQPLTSGNRDIQQTPANQNTGLNNERSFGRKLTDVTQNRSSYGTSVSQRTVSNKQARSNSMLSTVRRTNRNMNGNSQTVRIQNVGNSARRIANNKPLLRKQNSRTFPSYTSDSTKRQISTLVPAGDRRMNIKQDVVFSSMNRNQYLMTGSLNKERSQQVSFDNSKTNVVRTQQFPLLQGKNILNGRQLISKGRRLPYNGKQFSSQGRQLNSQGGLTISSGQLWQKPILLKMKTGGSRHEDKMDEHIVKQFLYSNGNPFKKKKSNQLLGGLLKR